MKAKAKIFRTLARQLIGLICVFLLIPGDALSYAQQPPQQPPPQAGQQASSSPKIPADQLDSLVAPIALYPDPLLAQTLAASTYPLEIVQLQQWLQKNAGLKDKALADAVAKEDWDQSVQALAPMPDLVKRLADDIQWTTDLGNAFLAQQSDVMAAVQRLRAKAKDKGNLKSSEQQKVDTQVIEGKQTIVIQPASTEVVYVPSYNPTVVYGPPVYPYPPVYYPPPGYYAAGMAISFGIGVAMGAFWGGGYGWGCGWGGGNNVYINHNNNFINNRQNINNINRPSQLPNRGGAGGVGGVGGAGRPGGVGGVGGAGGVGGVGGVGGAGRPGGVGGAGGVGGVGGPGGVGGAGRPGAGQLPAGGSNWQHNPSHRGGAPYADRATADRFGGSARGDSLSNRQGAARQQISQQGGNLGSARGGGAGAGNRSSGLGGGDRGGSVGSANRGGAGGVGGGGGDRVGNRSVSSGGGSRSAFGGGSSGFSGSSARASSSRGSSSFGGGGGRGGGGGGRSGGGGRRR